MTTPTVVQSAIADTGAANAAQPIFASAVTTGNTLFAMAIGAASAQISFPTPGTNGWALVGTNAQQSGNDCILMYARTALSTDGTTPPTINSNFNTFANGVMMWEIANYSNIDTSHADANTSGTGSSTATITSSGANELALLMVGTFFGNASTSTAGWGTADGTIPGGTIGFSGYHQAVPTSGTMLNAVITITSGGGLCYGIALIAGSTPPTPPSAGGPSFWVW